MACNAFQVSLSMHCCYWLANMCHGESTCHAIQAAANTVIMKFRLHVSSGFKTTDKHKTPSIETNSQTSQPQIKQERKETTSVQLSKVMMPRSPFRFLVLGVSQICNRHPCGMVKDKGGICGYV